MGRGLPDPPPEKPPEKAAEPYKPITLNGPPPSVQSCKWHNDTVTQFCLHGQSHLLLSFQTSMKICSVSSASLRSAVPKPRKGT